MTREDEEAVEEAARRTVDINRLWKAGELPFGAPSPTPLEIVEDRTGGDFPGALYGIVPSGLERSNVTVAS